MKNKIKAYYPELPYRKVKKFWNEFCMKEGYDCSICHTGVKEAEFYELYCTGSMQNIFCGWLVDKVEA